MTLSKIEQSVARIVDRVRSVQKKRGECFTLEAGRGETYRNNRPTLYGHWPYERSSVLAGRECRAFVESFESEAEAREALTLVKAECKAAKLRFKLDDLLGGGSTFVPISQVVAHLPDDTDY